MSFAQTATQVSNVPTAATMPYLAEIARDSDFNDKLEYSTPGELKGLTSKLEAAYAAFGEQRSYLADLLHSRISALHRHFAM